MGTELQGLLRAAFASIPSFVLAAALAAQGNDPGPAVLAFVESGPPGCAGPTVAYPPGFDPAFFPACWMPPQYCSPFEAAAGGGYTLVLPFRNVTPGAPCLLLVSPPGLPPVLPPCHYAVHEVLAFGIADANGNLVMNLPVPVIFDPGLGVVPLGVAQLVVLDVASPTSPPVLATSRVLYVEARF